MKTVFTGYRVNRNVGLEKCQLTRAAAREYEPRTYAFLPEQ